MLGPDVPIAEFVGNGDRLVENDSRPRRVGQIRKARLGARLTVLDYLLDRALDPEGRGTQVLENIHHQRVVFLEEAEDKVLGSDVLVIASMRFLARLDQRAAHPVCEIVAGQKASSSSLKILVWRLYRNPEAEINCNGRLPAGAVGGPAGGYGRGTVRPGTIRFVWVGFERKVEVTG